MRPIEFRAWSKKEKCWVDDFILDRLGNHYQTNKCEFWGDERDLEIVEWAGLKDKNGVKIFEGDIVRGSYGIPPLTIKSVVEYDGSAFIIRTSGHNPESTTLKTALEHLDLCVIGNLYENPELLNS